MTSDAAPAPARDARPGLERGAALFAATGAALVTVSSFLRGFSFPSAYAREGWLVLLYGETLVWAGPAALGAVALLIGRSERVRDIGKAMVVALGASRLGWGLYHVGLGFNLRSTDGWPDPHWIVSLVATVAIVAAAALVLLAQPVGRHRRGTTPAGWPALAAGTALLGLMFVVEGQPGVYDGLPVTDRYDGGITSVPWVLRQFNVVALAGWLVLTVVGPAVALLWARRQRSAATTGVAVTVLLSALSVIGLQLRMPFDMPFGEFTTQVGAFFVVAILCCVIVGFGAALSWSTAFDTARWVRRVAFSVFVAGLAYLVLLPLVRIQSLAFRDGGYGYKEAYTGPQIARTVRWTIGLALGSLAIAMVLGTLLAWAATRLPRRLQFLRIVPVLPIVLPAVASVIGWAFLFSPRPGYLNAVLRTLPWWHHLDAGPVDVYTLPWIVILTGFGLTAFVYLFVSAGFQNINSELLEAAQTSGSPMWRVFFTVTLPLLRPTLIYGGGVSLLLGLGQFTAPLLLGRQAGVTVMTTEMYREIQNIPSQYGIAAAFGTPLVVLGIMVVLVQKILLGDQKRFVTHGGKAFRAQGRPSKLAATALITYTSLATVLPVGALVIVSLSKFWSAKVDVAHFSLQNFRTVWHTPGIKNAIYNSVSISLFAVALTLPIGFIAASLLLRARRYPVLRQILDFVVSIPLGVPAVMFGVGFLYTYTRAPFILYGTRWVVVLVYVTLMLPFSTRMQLSGMIALGENYLEAARVSGASALKANLRIILPLMRPALGGAGALMFVLLTHEFSASLLVRSSTLQTMGTALFDQWSNGAFPIVAALALVMAVVTTIGVLVAILIGGADALSKL